MVLFIQICREARSDAHSLVDVHVCNPQTIAHPVGAFEQFGVGRCERTDDHSFLYPSLFARVRRTGSVIVWSSVNFCVEISAPRFSGSCSRLKVCLSLLFIRSVIFRFRSWDASRFLREWRGEQETQDMFTAGNFFENEKTCCGYRFIFCEMQKSV